MGLVMNLRAFDKQTENLVIDEHSKDFGEDYAVMTVLGLSIDNNINNGSYAMALWWVPILQPFFTHTINLNTYNYNISFNRDNRLI